MMPINDSNDDIQDDNNCNKIVLVPTNENNNFKSLAAARQPNK